MTVKNTNIGALISVLNAAGPVALTAGGAGDNTAVTGIILDRAAYGWPASAELCLAFTATLAAAATLSAAVTVQHGDDAGLSDATTFDSIANAVIATGPGGGGTVPGQITRAINLKGAKRYVRVNFTPDLSAANTDTARAGAVLAFGGANRLPQ
jgi:hypothetical protein